MRLMAHSVTHENSSFGGLGRYRNRGRYRYRNRFLIQRFSIAIATAMPIPMPIPKSSVVVLFSEAAVPANFIGVSNREPEPETASAEVG